MLRPQPAAVSAILLICSACTLSACASDAASYPSLARRPVERVTGSAPVVTPSPEAPAPASSATLGKLDSLLGEARAADRKFRDKQAAARGLVSAAAGSAMGSEAWSVATIALSELESARSQTALPMAELDALYVSAVVDGQSAGEIAAARNTVQGLLSDESAAIDALKAQLR
ncbi:hypothetical protein [Novosphingobium sp. B 225]|uniref:hypothetical protein n=1 Tax=Novosphingobium sp. B 225 TaxID=1961849 RepID=UPI000B4B9643|nr:hypothetical protein [Novosphingobium sp. B 225]